jgi:hypothetical protein
LLKRIVAIVTSTHLEMAQMLNNALDALGEGVVSRYGHNA